MKATYWIMDVASWVFDAYLPKNPATYGITNLQVFDDVLTLSDVACNAVGAKLPSRCPPPALPSGILQINSTDVAPNLLDVGLQLVSARLRELLQPRERDVYFLDVDASGCTPPVRAMDYRIIYVALFANLIDQERTEGEVVERQLSNGDRTRVWIRSSPRQRKSDGRLYRRADFEPPGSIFAIPGQRWIMVDDEVAERVMRAGIDDVQFIDILASSEQGRLVTRSF